jgi:lysozyme
MAGPTQPTDPRLVKTMGGAGLAMLLLTTLVTWEGWENTGYVDIAGVPTACAGDTHGVIVGKFYSDAECTRRLEEQAYRHVAPLKKCMPKLEGKPLVAFGSHAYNFGPAATCGSSIARRFNAGNLRGACDALLMWNKARVKGRLQVVRGLDNRRKFERNLCLEGLK